MLVALWPAGAADMRATLLENDTIRLVADVDSAREAVKAATAYQPELIVVAADQLEEDDRILLMHLRGASRQAKLIVCANDMCATAVAIAMWIRVSAYLLWTHLELDSLRHVLTLAASNMHCYSPPVLKLAFEIFSPESEPSADDALANQEEGGPA